MNILAARGSDQDYSVFQAKRRFQCDTVNKFPPVSVRRARMTSQNAVQLIAGIVCLLLVAVIVIRRKNKKKEQQQDDF